MTIPHDQTDYWDRAAQTKTFGHPVDRDMMERLLPLNSRILDYGCGYGRACSDLWEKGYRNLPGADSRLGRPYRFHTSVGLRVGVQIIGPYLADLMPIQFAALPEKELTGSLQGSTRL